MSIDFTLSIGYRRRRPSTEDKWEQRLDSIGLMLVGSAVAVAIVVLIVPRVLDWLSHL
jgi:hypothetical protein